MEKNEKIENPEWVNIVESLIPSARPFVGRICAQVIPELACIFEVSELLFDAVLEAVKSEISEVHNSDD